MVDHLEIFKLQQHRESFELDYPTYAKGEAALAWLDQTLLLHFNDNKAYAFALMLIIGIEKRIRKYHHTIRHLKFLMDDGKS